MKNFLLVLLALVLAFTLIPIAILYALIRTFFSKEKLSEFWWKIAVGIDQFGNVSCAFFLNDLLIHSSGHRFGDPDETISSVLGRNKETKTLHPLGKWLANLLNKIDEGHVEKSIGS